jgi:hypothetical protein
MVLCHRPWEWQVSRQLPSWAGRPAPPPYYIIIIITKVDLFKIDIEGFETNLIKNWDYSSYLPLQISIEFHYNLPTDRPGISSLDSVAEMALMLHHLADLGYGIAGKEVNFMSHVGCEFGLILLESPPHFIMHPSKPHLHTQVARVMWCAALRFPALMMCRTTALRAT